MKKTDAPEQVITRRKALGRIGLFATAAYTVPAFATLSMAHASSGASSASDGASDGASGASDGASGATSSQSESNSAPSAQSDVSTPSTPSPSDVEKACGVENLDTSTAEGKAYELCLIDNF